MLAAKYAIVTITGLSSSTALLALVLLPRLNWSAARQPSGIEVRLANRVRERWIEIHASHHKNPLAATPENLADGRKQYNEQCAICHGLDGSGRNSFHADFYPPVARLSGDTQQMTDAEIYFVISNGIALSGMPAFGSSHDSEWIWRLILWLRQFRDLTATGRNGIERPTSDQPQ